MQLNEYGEVVRACWMSISEHVPQTTVDVFVVMPNLASRASMAEPLKMQFGPDAHRHDPGTHRVEILVNGRAYPVGTFTVIRSARSTASKRP